MGLFDAAVAAITACPAWVEAATFTAPPAEPVSVTLYRARHDPVIDIGLVGARNAGWCAHLRQAEVPTRPRQDVDTLTIAGTVYRVRDVEEDAERTEWKLDLSEA